MSYPKKPPPRFRKKTHPLNRSSELIQIENQQQKLNILYNNRLRAKLKSLENWNLEKKLYKFKISQLQHKNKTLKKRLQRLQKQKNKKTTNWFVVLGYCLSKKIYCDDTSNTSLLEAQSSQSSCLSLDSSLYNSQDLSDLEYEQPNQPLSNNNNNNNNNDNNDNNYNTNNSNISNSILKSKHLLPAAGAMVGGLLL